MSVPLLTRLWSGCKVTNIARLQRIQNRASRSVFQVPRRHPFSELLDSLHWLPVEKRFIFEILLYICKSLNELSPKCLVDCFKIYVPPREGLRSALDETHLVDPRTNRLIGARSFNVCGSILWNDILPSIKVSTTVCSFKKSFKTNLHQSVIFMFISCVLLFRTFVLLCLWVCVCVCVWGGGNVVCVKSFGQFWILFIINFCNNERSWKMFDSGTEPLSK